MFRMSCTVKYSGANNQATVTHLVFSDTVAWQYTNPFSIAFDYVFWSTVTLTCVVVTSKPRWTRRGYITVVQVFFSH